MWEGARVPLVGAFCSSINSVPSSPRNRALTTDTRESPRRVKGHDQRSLMSNAYEHPRSATCDSNRDHEMDFLSPCRCIVSLHVYEQSQRYRFCSPPLLRTRTFIREIRFILYVHVVRIRIEKFYLKIIL